MLPHGLLMLLREGFWMVLVTALLCGTLYAQLLDTIEGSRFPL